MQSEVPMTTSITISASFPAGHDSARTVLIKQPGNAVYLTPDKTSHSFTISDGLTHIIEHETVSEWRSKKVAAAEAAKADQGGTESSD
jgi:hypothetical protein